MAFNSKNVSVLEKLNDKKAFCEYQFKRLNNRVNLKTTRLERLENEILLAQKKVKDFKEAINGIEPGEVKEFLKVQLVKANNNLFLLNERRGKIDTNKIVVIYAELNGLSAQINSLENSISEYLSQHSEPNNGLQFVSVSSLKPKIDPDLRHYEEYFESYFSKNDISSEPCGSEVGKESNLYLTDFNYQIDKLLHKDSA